MFEEDTYEKADISENEDEVKTVVETFVDNNKGDTTELQRTRLPKLKNKKQEAVDFVMNNLPTGVTRVDGYVIGPILKTVVNEKISELPEPETTEEV
ncbi:MAG: hypothetical protein ACOC5T_06580 [Elusimicrobiota bacterium]